MTDHITEKKVESEGKVCLNCGAEFKEPNFRKQPFCDWRCSKDWTFKNRLNVLLDAAIKYTREDKPKY